MAGDWYRYRIRKPGPIVTVMAMIYCPFVSTINGDDHNFMFTMCGSPRTVSWLGVTPSNCKFDVCGMQKGARKAARTDVCRSCLTSMDKENPYNENNQNKLCLQIEATFSGAEEKETTSESAPLKQLPPGMIKEGMNLTNEQRGVMMHAIGCALQAASVNLVAREKLSDVYLEIAARIQIDEPDTGGGGHGRHQLLLFTGDIISIPRVGSVGIRGKPRTLKLKLKVAEDTDFKREGSNLYVDSKISYSQIGVEGKRLRLQAKMEAWKHTILKRPDTVVLNS
ncbi:hypothetical protein Tco_0454058 [Tanacetum coccineum]